MNHATTARYGGGGAPTWMRIARGLLLGGALLRGAPTAVAADEAPPAETPAVAVGDVPDLDAEAIYNLLRQADAARGNLEGVSWTVEVTNTEGAKEQDSTFDVKARGFDVLAVVTRPRRNRGNLMLMNQGNMWFHKPDLSRPMPINQRQKLSGNAAYGDIAATNYAEDYDATALPNAEIDGEICHVLDLRARSRRCTYDRIVYFISQSRGVGVRADYYTLSGKLLKSADMKFENRVTDEEGEMKPFISEMTITDALMTGNATTMRFSNPVLREIPPSTFDVNLLAP